MTLDSPHSGAAEGELRFGRFRLLASQQTLYDGAERVRLGSRAFELLVILTRNAGELVSKERLLAEVWPNLHIDETALRVHVAALRKALGAGPQGEPYIVNIVGRGYRFSSPVTAVLSASPPAAPPPLQAPLPLLRIVGRDEAIGAIARQLPQHRLVTIVGAGGIGKTTVALALAEQLAGDYAQAVRAVDLSPLAHDGLVPAAVAFSLGLSNLSEDPSGGVVAFLRDKHMLLVLDCCERVIEGAAILAEQILSAAPGLHILATSREPLRALGERVVRLPPLGAPLVSAGITAEQAAAYPAVQLFVERASASLDEFALNDGNAPLVAELCIRLDGIALAIELAAGHANAFDLQTLATMLTNRLTLLGSGRRTAVPRHKTLRAVLDWSFETIADREQLLLQRLSVFTGAPDLPSLQDVAADAALSRSDIVEALATLVDKSLVAADLRGGTARYRLLDTTRAYAAERLHQSGEAAVIARRHADHCLAAIATARVTWTARPFTDWLTEYSRMLGDVRGALDWAFAPGGDTLLGIELTAEALPVMFELSLAEECRRRAGAALAALQALAAPDPTLEMRLRTWLAAALTYTPGPVPQTVLEWESVLRIATDLAATSAQARALWGLWTASVWGNRPREGLAYAERFCQLRVDGDKAFTDLPGDRIVGVALHFMGEQAAARSHLEKIAANYIPRSYEYYTPGFQIDHGAMARVTLARVLWVVGDTDHALATLVQVLDDVRRQNHAIFICYAIFEAALPILIMMADLDGAERELDGLEALAEQNGLAIWLAGARCMRLAIQAKRGTAVPLGVLREALWALRATGYTAHATWLCGIVAEAGHPGDTVEARIGVVDEAVAEAQLAGAVWNLPELLRIRALLTLLQRQAATDHARALLVQALALARRQGARSWEIRIAATATELLANDEVQAQALC